jgi:transposase-like protein
MRCPRCGSERIGERPERTAQGYRRFRCRACGKQFNERTGTALNRTVPVQGFETPHWRYAAAARAPSWSVRTWAGVR